MRQVREVEQVGDGGCLVGDGGRRRVAVPDEVEHLGGRRRAAVHVRQIVGVAIQVGVDVVPRGRVAPARQPAVGRGDLVGRVGEELLGADRGIVREDAVALVLRAQLLAQDLAAPGNDRHPEHVRLIPGLDEVSAVQRASAQRHRNARDLRRHVERRDARVGRDVTDARHLAGVRGHGRVVARDDGVQRRLGPDQRGPEPVRRRDEVLDQRRQVPAGTEARLHVRAVDVEAGDLLAVPDVHRPERLALPRLHEIAERGGVVRRAQVVANRLASRRSAGRESPGSRGTVSAGALRAEIGERVRPLSASRAGREHEGNEEHRREDGRTGARHGRPPRPSAGRPAFRLSRTSLLAKPRG